MKEPRHPREHGDAQEDVRLSPGDAGHHTTGRDRPGGAEGGNDGPGEPTPAPWPPAGARTSRADVGEVELDLVEVGPVAGPPVVLLHGFPEFSFGWRHQIGALAAAGFRVLAPDQRGYAGSGCPAGIDAYRIDRLAGDVVGLLDALDLRRAHLVGHDWGAAVAWWAALAHPDRVRRLAILNVPHPGVMRRALVRNPRQLLRSSYIFFFQLPWLPEASMRPGGFAPLVRGMTRSSLPGTFSEPELERYRRAWARPGALTAMLNWYRALRRAPQLPRHGRVRTPTLVLWGARDAFLGVELARPSVEHCDSGRLVLLEDSTHWLHHEAPHRVSEELIRHLATGAAR